MDSFQVGTLAEGVVRDACVRAGLSASKPYPDQDGCDFLVFDAGDNHPMVGFDVQAPVNTYFLQVKGISRAEKARVKINLRNWGTMVKQPVPWFILLVRYDGSSLHSVGAVHVWDNYIGKILKRLRQLPPNALLHKHHSYLYWREAQELPLSNLPRDLTSFLRNSVDIEPAYHQAKRKLVESVGYPEGGPHDLTWRMNAAMNEGAIHTAMAEWAIGLRHTLSGEFTRHTITRFEITKDAADDAITTPALNQLTEISTIPPSIGESLVTLRHPTEQTSVTLRCQTFASNVIFPFLPKSYWKARLVSEKVEVIFDTEEYAVRFRFGDLGAGSIASLEHAANVGSMISSCEAVGLHMDIAWSNGATSSVGPQDVSSVRINVDANLFPGILLACRVAAAAGISREEQLCTDEIMDQLPRLQVLECPSGVDHPLALSATIESSCAPLGDRAAIVVPFSAKLGDWIVSRGIALVGYSVETRTDDGRVRCEFGPQTEFRSLWQRCVPLNNWSSDEEQAWLETEVIALEAQGIGPILRPAATSG